MKKIILLIAIAGFARNSNAQIVSMTKSEIKVLRKDIDTNNNPSTYKKAYHYINETQKLSNLYSLILLITNLITGFSIWQPYQLLIKGRILGDETHFLPRSICSTL